LSASERYPQVQHLVSTIEGQLRRDMTHFSAFRLLLSWRSVTGAPKIRAMEIIDELSQSRAVLTPGAWVSRFQS